jgi:hypothetical protein
MILKVWTIFGSDINLRTSASSVSSPDVYNIGL